MGDLGKLRAFYESGAFEAGWNLYQTELAEWPGPEWHYYGARCARALGDLPGARRAIMQAIALNPTGALLGQTLFTCGIILRESGENGTAAERFREALARMEEYPNLRPVMDGPTYYNLGLTLRSLGDMAGALDCYRRAADIQRREDLREQLRMTLQNIAWLLCILGDATGAREALDEAEPLIANPQGRWQQQLGMAFLVAVEGDRERALHACEAITNSPESVPLDVRSHAYWLAGRIALEIGQYPLALQLGQAALDWGQQAQTVDMRCWQDASKLLREIRQRQMQGA